MAPPGSPEGPAARSAVAPAIDRHVVGEVGFPPAEDRAKRLKNQASAEMAKNMARNLVYYAQLLKQHPLVPKQ